MDELKNKGNECLRSGQVEEAIKLYSEALDIEPTAVLYSNRSNAYLKLDKYYEADCDAQRAINMNRLWSKGYFRVGEVRLSIGQYSEAITAYTTAQMLQQREEGKPDPVLQQRLQQAHNCLQKQTRYARNMPWVCAGVGLIFAVFIIVADYALAKTPVITHVLVQSLLVLALSGVGGAVGRVWMWYTRHLRRTKLQPTLEQEEQQQQTVETEGDADDRGSGANGGAGGSGRQQHPRYTKAQARQRFKKGKS